MRWRKWGKGRERERERKINLQDDDNNGFNRGHILKYAKHSDERNLKWRKFKGEEEVQAKSMYWVDVSRVREVCKKKVTDIIKKGTEK